MDSYDKRRITALINDENGTNYHKNVPLDGFTVTLGDSFISFAFREINGITTALIHYIYVIKKEDFITLLGYCVNMWKGYGVKMIYYREHRRKSNIVSTLKHLGLDVQPMTKKSWTHKWTSTNGFAESDCIEAFSKV